MPSYDFAEEIAGRFLEALIQNGGRIQHACEHVGMTWGMVYQWRRSEPEFATAMDDAVMISTMVLEEEALRLGLEGDTTHQLDSKGELVMTKVKRYPQLLMFMLEARNPGRYRRTVKVEGLVPPDSRPVLEGVANAARRSFELMSVAHKVERVFDVAEDGTVGGGGVSPEKPGS